MSDDTDLWVRGASAMRAQTATWLMFTGHHLLAAKVLEMPLPTHSNENQALTIVRTDTERALEIMTRTVQELEPLWDYLPHRPLGWLDLIMAGILEELKWKVEHKIC